MPNARGPERHRIVWEVCAVHGADNYIVIRASSVCECMRVNVAGTMDVFVAPVDLRIPGVFARMI